MTFRCSAAAVDRGDSIAGSASTVRSFLLVENPGPWGVDAVRDSRLPAAVKDGLRIAAARAKVRPLLVRRYHRRAPRTGFRVYAARAGLDESWLQTAVLDRAEDLLDIDLDALGAGRSPGLVPTEEVLFCVCTHGKHDACCAEKGRPVAGALSAAYPEETWEVSHIGGDRFAGNALVLPYGLYLGRLDARVGRRGGRRRPRRPAAPRRAARPVVPADGGPGRRDRAVPPPRRDRDGRRARAAGAARR